MDELIRKRDAINQFEGHGKGFWGTTVILDRLNALPAVEPKTKVIAQVTFDEDKMREIVHEAVERIKKEYDIVDKSDAVSEWIPCSEKLPEDEGVYIVTIKKTVFNTETTSVGTAFCSQEHKWFVSNYINCEVLAWMSLPAPYEGKVE